MIQLRCQFAYLEQFLKYETQHVTTYKFINITLYFIFFTQNDLSEVVK
jgi:hypothetical protein